MKPKISVVTLGVDSLEASLKFYRDGLGWPTKGIMATEYQGDEKNAAGAVVMFRLNDDLILALYPRKELAKDAHRPLDSKSASEFSLGHLVESRSEVDELIDRPWLPERLPRSRHANAPGESTRVTSRIRMATFGRSSGTLNNQTAAGVP